MAAANRLQPYDEAEIRARLTGDLRHWRFEQGSIVRVYRTNDWKATLVAVAAVGHLAQLAWHHPELRATFSSLEVRLDTHDAGGVTDRDFELARRIEAVMQWRPAADGGALEGLPADEAKSYVAPDN